MAASMLLRKRTLLRWNPAPRRVGPAGEEADLVAPRGERGRELVVAERRARLDREAERVVALRIARAAGLGDGIRAPGPPVDRVVRMLQQVRAGGTREAIGHGPSVA